MPGAVGLPEIMIVLVIALIVLGPKRLPEMARNMGKGIREFRQAISLDSITGGGDDDEDDDDDRDRKRDRDREADEASSKA